MNQFTDAGAALIGMSVDSAPSLNAWSVSMGGMRHPLLADFWPKGGVAQSLGIFNETAGIVNRSVIIIDPEGVVRHAESYTRSLPDPAEALARLAELQRA